MWGFFVPWIYLLGLWKDHTYNTERSQESIAQTVREKYIKLYILQTLIGPIGIIEIVRLFVQTVIKDKKTPRNASREDEYASRI